MKIKVLILIIVIVIVSCNTTGTDFGKYKYEGKSIFGYKFGEWKAYYPDDQLWKVYNYKKNKLSGKYIQFYNKKYFNSIGGFENYSHTPSIDPIYHLPLQETGYFSNDKINGIVTKFETDTYTKANYVNGKIQGEVICYFNKKKYYYHKNKNDIRSKVNTKDGKEDGEKLTWDEDGNILSSINYILGKLNGEVKLFYKSGYIKQKTIYKNGRKVSEIFFNEKDKLIK